MRKLKLDLNGLSVETFQPHAAERRAGGTVHAHVNTHEIRCTAICTWNCTGIPCFATARPAC